MKKYTKPLVICLAVFLVLSILCYAELGSFNVLRTGIGMARVMLADETVAQIADYPHKAYLVSPDDGCEVFMAWKPLEEAMEIEPQTLTAPQRSGFTVVEWGGGKVI